MNIRNMMAVAALAAGTMAQAQDTYLNDRLTAVDDINGSARYVGMGGALGALGADLSVISSNPAGIGLYRKSDVGFTFGVVVPNGNGWDSDLRATHGDRLARATFDQAGMVFCLHAGGDRVKFVNFAVNYQKKLNYNQGFFANNGDLGGLSQMDQLAKMAWYDYGTQSNLTGLAMMPVERDRSMDDHYLTRNGDGTYTNDVPSQSNTYTRHQRGSLQSYDINASFNIDDRVYVGATFGVDNLDYQSWSDYGETAVGGGDNYSLYNDVRIDGYGFNVKLGVILRPIEASSLRVGLTMETPTWYRLKNSTIYSLDMSDQIESYLEYTVRTPWKVRVSLGSTVGSLLAWGLEYEYANYGKTSMGYPEWDEFDPYHPAMASQKDYYMNQHTKNTLRGQHTLRAGVEVKPLRSLALRAGYNYVSSRYKDGATFDQCDLDSYAMNYSTGTDYMTLGDANILTLGAGYTFKKNFYVDLTYKFRAQSGDFYAFDTTGMDGTIAPVNVNLNRSQVVVGFGYKF